MFILQAVFADVPQTTEKMDVIFDLAEKLRPTLDLNDGETLKQSVSNLNTKLNSVAEAARQHQKQLEAMAQGWSDYQVTWNLNTWQSMTVPPGRALYHLCDILHVMSFLMCR